MINKVEICKQLMSWDEDEVIIDNEYDWAEKVGYKLYEKDGVKHMEAVSIALNEVEKLEKEYLQSYLKYYINEYNKLISLLKFLPAPPPIKGYYHEKVKQFINIYNDWLNLFRYLNNKQ